MSIPTEPWPSSPPTPRSGISPTARATTSTASIPTARISIPTAASTTATSRGPCRMIPPTNLPISSFRIASRSTTDSTSGSAPAPLSPRRTSAVRRIRSRAMSPLSRMNGRAPWAARASCSRSTTRKSTRSSAASRRVSVPRISPTSPASTSPARVKLRPLRPVSIPRSSPPSKSACAVRRSAPGPRLLGSTPTSRITSSAPAPAASSTDRRKSRRSMAATATSAVSRWRSNRV